MFESYDTGQGSCLNENTTPFNAGLDTLTNVSILFGKASGGLDSPHFRRIFGEVMT